MTLVDQSPDLGGIEESPQLLFPEARRRRHRRRTVGIAVAMLFVLGIVVCATGIFTRSTGSDVGRGSLSPTSAGPTTGFGTVSGTANAVPGIDMGFGPKLWFVSQEGKKTAVNVPADGGFQVRLPSGSYTVSARGHWTLPPNGIAKCSTKAPFDVPSGSTVHIAVSCVGQPPS
jgi:hypothetical protein